MLILAVLVTLTGWHLLASIDVLRIRTVRYDGLRHIAREELTALSPVKAGDNLLAADLEAMERALAHHPWVKSAVAHRRLPPEIEVRVQEREARALVDFGGLYLVDREAQVYKRAAVGDRLDLPVITGFSREDYVQRRTDVEALLSGAVALLEGYSSEGLAALAAVSEIHMDADEGVTLFLGDEGIQARLGAGDLPSKLARLRLVLESLRARGARADILHLDNRQHPSWITVRLRQGKGQSEETTLERAGRPAGRMSVVPPRQGLSSADAAVKTASQAVGRKGPSGP